MGAEGHDPGDGEIWDFLCEHDEHDLKEGVEDEVQQQQQPAWGSSTDRRPGSFCWALSGYLRYVSDVVASGQRVNVEPTYETRTP